MKAIAKKGQRVTAKEKKMIDDYVKARKAESRAALKAWARKYKKYKVKLKRGNRVAFVGSCRGASVLHTVLEKTKCSDVCPGTLNQSWKRGGWRVELVCTLSTCRYDRTLGWICYYNCTAATFKPAP